MSLCTWMSVRDLLCKILTIDPFRPIMAPALSSGIQRNAVSFLMFVLDRFLWSFWWWLEYRLQRDVCIFVWCLSYHSSLSENCRGNTCGNCAWWWYGTGIYCCTGICIGIQTALRNRKELFSETRFMFLKINCLDWMNLMFGSFNVDQQMTRAVLTE